MKTKKNLIKDSAILSAGQYVAQVSNIVRGFVVAAFLSPETYGLWSKILFYVNYQQFLTLGSDVNIRREINQDISDRDQAFLLLSFFIKYVKRLTAVFMILLTIMLFLNNATDFNKGDPFFYNALFVFFFVSSSLNLLYRIPVNLLPSYGLFKHVAVNRIINAISNLLFVVIFCPFFGIYGMFIAYGLSIFTPMAVMGFKFRSVINEFILYFFSEKSRKSLALFNAKKFIKTSISLVLVTFLFQMWLKYDRLFITFLFDNASAGPYFFGANISNSLMAIVTSAAGVIYQNMNVNFGKGVPKEKLFKDLMSTMQVFSIVQPFLLMLIYYAAPVLITEYFKQYILSIGYLKVLLFLNLFLAHFVLAFNLFLTLKKQNIFFRYISIYYFIIGIIYVFCSRFFSLSSFPIIAIASNSFFALFLYYKLKVFSNSKHNFFRTAFVYFYPPFCFFISVYVSGLLVDFSEFKILSVLLSLVLSLLVYGTLIVIASGLYVDKLKVKKILPKK